MIARTKFKCVKNQIIRGSSDVTMQAVTKDSHENAGFFKYDPAGQITLYSVNADVAKLIEENQEYYIDITPVN